MAREVTQGYCKDSACAYDVYTKHFIDEKVIPYLGSGGGGSSADIRATVIDILVEYGLIELEGLTSEQIQAINNMICEIDENGNLKIDYDDTLLAINFEIENGNLIVENNVDSLSFNINNNGEMEAIY